MLSQIGYYLILGKPLTFYLGFITLAAFFATGLIPLLRQRAIWNIPMQWHFRLGKIAIGLALLHGLLAMSAYF